MSVAAKAEMVLSIGAGLPECSSCCFCVGGVGRKLDGKEEMGEELSGRKALRVQDPYLYLSRSLLLVVHFYPSILKPFAQGR